MGHIRKGDTVHYSNGTTAPVVFDSETGEEWIPPEPITKEDLEEFKRQEKEKALRSVSTKTVCDS